MEEVGLLEDEEEEDEDEVEFGAAVSRRLGTPPPGRAAVL